jgi:hypothetical protein
VAHEFDISFHYVGTEFNSKIMQCEMHREISHCILLQISQILFILFFILLAI